MTGGVIGVSVVPGISDVLGLKLGKGVGKVGIGPISKYTFCEKKQTKMDGETFSNRWIYFICMLLTSINSINFPDVFIRHSVSLTNRFISFCFNGNIPILWECSFAVMQNATIVVGLKKIFPLLGILEIIYFKCIDVRYFKTYKKIILCIFSSTLKPGVNIKLNKNIQRLKIR